MSIYTSASAVIVLVLALASLGHTASGEVPPECDDVCYDFKEAASQCAENRGCYAFAQIDEAKFNECTVPCFEKSAPCFALCIKNYVQNWEMCESECVGNRDFQCDKKCFKNTFQKQRAGLKVPSPAIAPFTG